MRLTFGIAVFFALLFGPVVVANLSEPHARWLRHRADVDAYTIAYVLGTLAIMALWWATMQEQTTAVMVGSLVAYFALMAAPSLLNWQMFRRIREHRNDARNAMVYVSGYVAGNIGAAAAIWM